MKTEIYTVASPDDIAPAAARAAAVLEAGGLAAFPTETVYGLAACAGRPEAMERLRELKSRPAGPFTVHIGEHDQAFDHAADPPGPARRLMRNGWPGPVTIVLPAGETAATRRWGPSVVNSLRYEGTIALRLPDDPVARRMLAAVSEPVVAPSANEAGQTPPRTARDVLDVLDGRIELVIDAGPTRVGRSSTIVRFDEQGRWTILREGLLGEAELSRLMRRQMLFVCTGNTCRSPMAEGLARLELSRRLDCRPAELAVRGWRVISAGTAAFPGSPATEAAIRAAGRLGADIAAHRNQTLTAQLINSSDLIFCMTDSHRRQVCDLSPSAEDRTRLLDPDGVPDPIGGSDRVYRQTAEHIHRAICAQLDAMADL